MEQTLTLPQTHIGKKAIMAVSGVALVGFVVAHLLGNLQVFLGPEVMNEYAASLRKIPAILWGMRIGLLLAVIAHVLSAVALVSANAEARPVGYAKVKHQKSTYASRTMRWGGPIILLYIIYHLLHLTFGFGFDADHPYTPHNAYNNVLFGFRSPLNTGIYIFATVLVAMHLRHGVWSMFQSLGFNHPRYNDLRERLAMGIAGFILVGNVFIPAAVFLSWHSDGVREATGLEVDTANLCYPELSSAQYPCPADGAAPAHAEEP